MEKRFDKPFQKREDKYTPREKENDDIIFGVRAVIEAINSEKADQLAKLKPQSSLTRIKNIRSVDLKKLSPYLSRN
jgi:hypothetical protein